MNRQLSVLVCFVGERSGAGVVCGVYLFRSSDRDKSK